MRLPSMIAFTMSRQVRSSSGVNGLERGTNYANELRAAAHRDTEAMP